jgi:GntR family transcriptional regulator
VRGTRYIGIADTLRDRIRNGDYPAGTALPSQKDLGEIFSTTVMTVRQALSVLEREGLLTMAHGVGTFVSTGAERGRDLRLRGLTDSMSSSEARIDTRIVGRDYKVREPRVLAIIGKGALKCCCLTRMRLVGGEPVIFQRSYLPLRFKSVVRSLTDGDSLYAFLSSACGGVVEGREIVMPVTLKRKEAIALGESAGTAALLSLRASFDLTQAPVLYDEAYIRAGRVFLSIRQSGNLHVSSYRIPQAPPPDPAGQLLSHSFWGEDP